MIDTKKEVLRLHNEHGLTGYKISLICSVDKRTAYYWIDDKKTKSKPNVFQLNELKKHVGEPIDKNDWRYKTGIEAVIANMYAVEEMG